VREENFSLHVEKVVVTVTTTLKSGGEMSPPSYTKFVYVQMAIYQFAVERQRKD